MGHSLFTRLSQVVHARDIQEELAPPLKANMTIHEALGYIHGMGLRGELFLVQRDKTFVGWVELRMLDAAWWEWGEGDIADETWPKEWPGCVGSLFFVANIPEGDPRPTKTGRNAPVESVMSPLQYMSADTPLFETARILGDKVPRAILEGTEVTGTVDYLDLCKAPFRVLLFALVMEVEQLALRLIMKDALCNWNVLNEKSKEQAIYRSCLQEGERLLPEQIRAKYAFAFDPRVAKREGGTGQKGLTANQIMIHFYMQHIAFGDKLHVIARRRLIRDLPTDELKRLLSQAKQLRIACAHPQEMPWGTFEPVMKGDWWDVVTDMHRLMASIVKAGNPDDEV